MCERAAPSLAIAAVAACGWIRCDGGVEMSAATLKSGFLEKEGGKGIRIFQSRYFVLRGRTLYWFRNRRDQEPAGTCLLPACKIDSKPIGQPETALWILAPRKKYILRCANAQEKSEWAQALNEAGGHCLRSVAVAKRRSDDSRRKQSPARRARSFSDTAAAPGLHQYAPAMREGERNHCEVQNPFNLGFECFGDPKGEEYEESDSDSSLPSSLEDVTNRVRAGSGLERDDSGPHTNSSSSTGSRSSPSPPPVYCFPKVVPSPLRKVPFVEPADPSFLWPPPTYPAPLPPFNPALLPSGRNPVMAKKPLSPDQ